MQENKRKRIEKDLRQYAAVCEKFLSGLESCGKKEERIKALLQVTALPRTRGNRCNFVLEQLGYLGRYCLFWQALWAVVFVYLVRYGMFCLGGENQVLVLISLLPPLLVLLTVEEITKVYQRSMLEIEYATKYSLQNVVIIRMLVLSVFHFIILAAAIIIFHAGLDSGIGKLFIYGFTPMIIVTGILMKLMQYCHGEQLRGAGVGVYVLTVMLASAGNTRYFGWYQPAYFKVWCTACAAGILFGVWQFFCLRRKLISFERIIKF